MDNYDDIVQDLQLTIADYKDNLEQIKKRFEAINRTVDLLTELSERSVKSLSTGEQLLNQISDIQLNYTEIEQKTRNSTVKMSQVLTGVENENAKLTESFDAVLKKMADGVEKLKADYHTQLNQALKKITAEAQKDADSIDKYLLTFSSDQNNALNAVQENLTNMHEKTHGKIDASAQKLTEHGNMHSQTISNRMNDVQSSITGAMDVAFQAAKEDLDGAMITLCELHDRTYGKIEESIPHIEAIQHSIRTVLEKAEGIDSDLHKRMDALNGLLIRQYEEMKVDFAKRLGVLQKILLGGMGISIVGLTYILTLMLR